MGERRVTNKRTLAFMEFFSKELGCKFIDADTGKIVNLNGELEDEENAI